MNEHISNKRKWKKTKGKRYKGSRQEVTLRLQMFMSSCNP